MYQIYGAGQLDTTSSTTSVGNEDLFTGKGLYDINITGLVLPDR